MNYVPTFFAVIITFKERNKKKAGFILAFLGVNFSY